MNVFIYKPSGKSWPEGQRATGSKLAARLTVEHFQALPTVPRSDQTSPVRTRLTLIQLETQREGFLEGVGVYFELKLESNKMLQVTKYFIFKNDGFYVI